MTRTLIFAGLAAVSVLLPSCFPILGCPSSGKSLVLTTAEELEMVKKETNNAIMLTVRKVKDDEMDLHTGKDIIDNLKEIIKSADSLLTVCAHLDSVGRREEILRFMELAGAGIQNKKKTLNCLNDLYDISTHYQLETDTYFPAGVYGIPPDKRDEAQKTVGLIVQDIIKFLNDHPRQKFLAVITCYGFTDETPVTTESIRQIRSRWCKVSYDFVWLGKGEELPYPDKIKDYKPEDKRRRLVHLTWHVLPGSLYSKPLYEY